MHGYAVHQTNTPMTGQSGNLPGSRDGVSGLHFLSIAMRTRPAIWLLQRICSEQHRTISEDRKAASNSAIVDASTRPCQSTPQ